MNRLSENPSPSLRRPWRRRISNQLAAVAAVMLFASTQVGVPEESMGMDTARAQVGSQGELSDIGGGQLELKASLDQATGDTAKKSAKTKKKSFQLNLFRFRR